MIAALVMVAFAFGGQPLIGYNYGSGNRVRLKKILKFAYSFECSLGIGMTLILSVAAPFMLRMFLKDEMLGTDRCCDAACCADKYDLYGNRAGDNLHFPVGWQGDGCVRYVFVQTGSFLAVVLVIAAKILGYNGVLWAQPIADVLTAAVGVLLMLKVLGREISG